MKKTLLLIILFFSCFTSHSQQKSLFNINVGASLFSGNSEASYYKYHLAGFPSVSLEKDFNLKVFKKERFRFSPGINYLRLNEQSEIYSLADQDFSELSQSTFSIYSKAAILFHTYKKRSPDFYAGLLGGFNILTRTKGK